jgi:hypothetical protein
MSFDLLCCDRTSSLEVLGWFDFMFRQESRCSVVSQEAPQETVAAEEYPEGQSVSGQ